MRHPILSAACLAAVLLPGAAFADNAQTLQRLQQQIEQLKQHYDAQVAALQAQVTALQQQVAAADQAPPVAAATPASANAFNPAIALVLQGKDIHYSRDPAKYALPGFPLGGEAGLEDEGPGLGETEMNLRANVDQLFYGEATLSLANSAVDGSSIDAEEAFLDTLTLPWGLGLRFGRFFTEVGYLNTHHSHTWDFVDAPLTSQAFLGGQYGDDGLRLSWIAPTDTYLELGLELLRGQEYPAGTNGSRFFGGARNAFVRLSRDLDDSNTLLLGLSVLQANPTDRESGDFRFSGHSWLGTASGVWKWAPQGNAYRHSFTLQSEFFYRRERGRQSFMDPAGSTATALLPYSGDQQGLYAQGVYKFMPRLRAGLRYDHLWSDNSLRLTSNTTTLSSTDLLGATGLLDLGHDPSRWSAMLDFSPSEFSRLRVQFARDKSRGGSADYQTMVQYIMSIGSHGAHIF